MQTETVDMLIYLELIDLPIAQSFVRTEKTISDCVTEPKIIYFIIGHLSSAVVYLLPNQDEKGVLTNRCKIHLLEIENWLVKSEQSAMLLKKPSQFLFYFGF